MSLQTELNKIVEFMRKQGRPAYNNDRAACMYRTPEGNKCAVGCRISDDFILRHKISNVATVGEFSEEAIQELAQLTETEPDDIREFYARMQTAHDEPATGQYSFTGAGWLIEFEVRARQVAQFFQLTYPEPET